MRARAIALVDPPSPVFRGRVRVGVCRAPPPCLGTARLRGILVLLLLLASGCAADPPISVSISSWRQSVERYIWDQGNGDPSVLRELSWDDRHRGFATFSDPMPSRSTDVDGLLLAHRQVEGRWFFVFLVAIVDHQSLRDLRPVALNVDQGIFQWNIAPDDDYALTHYRTWALPEDHTASGTGNISSAFPGPAEDFEVRINGRRITVLHAPSTAGWEVTVPPPSRSYPASREVGISEPGS